MSDLPDDFDPEVYLQLNRDVAAAGVDPVQHYLRLGRAKGRRYKEEDQTAPVGQLDTMVLTRPDLFRGRLGRETLLVTGAARGGTSLAAYALLRLGYPLLSDMGQNHEHSEFVEARMRRDALAQLITRENATHARWGFKLPAAVRDLPWYATALRDPVMLIVCRNPVAVYRSVDRHGKDAPKGQLGVKHGLNHGVAALIAAKEAVDLEVPVILLDLDQAQRKPKAFVRDLATLFNLPFDEAVAGEIATPGYKKLPDAP